MKRSFFLLLFFSLFVLADQSLESLFTERGVKGTIIIQSLDGKELYVANKERAQKQMLPASTFKILNSLIALENEVISSIEDVIKWDGVDNGWALWNKDHTMKSAFPVSCVWFYQELAKKIGNKTYLEVLEKVSYGNKKTGSELTNFWLEGDLAISAEEQIAFLKTFYMQKLPFKKLHQETVKELMLLEGADTYSLYGKTGWTKQHGWFVGFIEAPDKVWLYATNVDILKKEDAKYRKEITVEAFKALKILK